MAAPQSSLRDPANNEGKVFVGGLSRATTDQTMREFFSQFGAIREAQVMTRKDIATGMIVPRGFGFVIFEDPTTVESVVGAGNFQLDDKTIEVKRIDTNRQANAATGGPGGAPQQGTVEKGKIFVGGLPDGVDGDYMRDYFSKFDQVIDAKVMTKPEDGRPRGFGYVTFASDEGVRKAIETKADHIFNGKWVEVKECYHNAGGNKGGKGKGKGKGGADPYAAMYGRPSAYGAAPSGGYGYGGAAAYGYGGAAAYGAPAAYGYGGAPAAPGAYGAYGAAPAAAYAQPAAYGAAYGQQYQQYGAAAAGAYGAADPYGAQNGYAAAYGAPQQPAAGAYRAAPY